MRIIDLKKTSKHKAISHAVKILKNGGLIVYPTETCYGAGVDCTSSKAVEKLLNYKGKRLAKGISIAVANAGMAKQYVKINQTAKNLYQNFLPGPLTIVSKSKGRAVKQLETVNNTLGIRIPDYPFVLQLIKVLGKPITSTSANISGRKSPYSIKTVLENPKKSLNLIDFILDAGRLPYRPPSSVVDTTQNELKILRQGRIKIKEDKQRVFISLSERQTQKIAGLILKKHKKLLKNKVLVFGLQGELGAGKTQFSKGLAGELGIKSNLPSPTFILMREYVFQIREKKAVFYHIDAWRMEKGEELLGLGFKKMLAPGNVIAIEWLEKVKPILEKIEKSKKIRIVWTTIDYLSRNKRKIKYQ